MNITEKNMKDEKYLAFYPSELSDEDMKFLETYHFMIEEQEEFVKNVAPISYECILRDYENGDEDMNIVEIIQMQVDKIVIEKYNIDECQPIFIISLFENDKLLITCKHLGKCLSESLFPTRKEDVEDWLYGLKGIEYHMRNLYNRTM